MIGAGMAGITAGILLPTKVPGIELTIFEKNKDVVGLRPKLSCDWEDVPLIAVLGRDMVRKRISRRAVGTDP